MKRFTRPLDNARSPIEDGSVVSREAVKSAKCNGSENRSSSTVRCGGGYQYPFRFHVGRGYHSETLNRPAHIVLLMRYIVTGGAGPGSNLADILAQHHDVAIIDNLATGPAGRRSSTSPPADGCRGEHHRPRPSRARTASSTRRPIVPVGDRAPSPRTRRTSPAP